MFDNLDGRRFYEPAAFYAQSKLANALYAKELARRLGGRGIAVNSADPGAARTKLNPRFATRLFAKTAAQAAATPALLAASPRASGITGEYWRDCKISEGNALLDRCDARRDAFGTSRSRFSSAGKNLAICPCSKPPNPTD